MTISKKIGATVDTPKGKGTITKIKFIGLNPSREATAESSERVRQLLVEFSKKGTWYHQYGVTVKGAEEFFHEGMVFNVQKD